MTQGAPLTKTNLSEKPKSAQQKQKQAEAIDELPMPNMIKDE